ncbi:MAG: nucleotidyltransferase family protein [Chloroflexota bacterium]|nr:nucleotidyltransferase family protein [Chloroflexota bacterium]MDE2896484.1 nucleotidyltransferase family protein [Chloroflexota bacterium]
MIAAILLAAGESTRMGRPKQLLDWHGRPLVAAQIETLLSAGCRPVVVVLGAHANSIRPILPSRAEVQLTTNRNWRAGRASSIRTGARAVPTAAEAVVITSVDQPTEASVIERLHHALTAARDALIAVPRHNGRNGHPPMFRAELLSELRSVSERQEGLRQVRRRHAERTIFVEVDNPIVTLNLNTPEEYRRALELL